MSRQVVSSIENYIDQRVGKQLILPYSDTKPMTLFLMAVKAMVGIHEEGGNNSGQLVNAIQASVGDSTGDAWCMAMIQTAIAYAEKKTGRIAKCPAGDNCMDVLERAKKLDLTTESPNEGDLIIWEHGQSSSGHVGCIIETGDAFYRTVEGNTSCDDKTVQREGDGVYTKLRSHIGTDEMPVVGFVRIGF